MARFVQELIALQISLTKLKLPVAAALGEERLTGQAGFWKALVPLFPGNIDFDPVSPRAAAWTRLHGVQEDAHGGGGSLTPNLLSGDWKQHGR